eukprot:Gb_35894 [translate_table: standard]
MNCLLKSQETDFLAMKGPYDELTEEAGPSKRCKGIDSVTSFPFSKRVQTTSIPVTQDCNDKHTNLRGNDECFVNRTALHEEGKSIEVNVSHKVKVTAPLATEEKHEEIDPHRLSQRQKQIDYGKNTLGYERYIELVPRDQRKKDDIQTPDVKQVCSKRRWDGQVRKWRRLLHEFDHLVSENEEKPEFFPVGGKRKYDSAKNRDNMLVATESKIRPRRTEEFLKIYQNWIAKEPKNQSFLHR